MFPPNRNDSLFVFSSKNLAQLAMNEYGFITFVDLLLAVVLLLFTLSLCAKRLQQIPLLTDKAKFAIRLPAIILTLS